MARYAQHLLTRWIRLFIIISFFLGMLPPSTQAASVPRQPDNSSIEPVSPSGMSGTKPETSLLFNPRTPIQPQTASPTPTPEPPTSDSDDNPAHTYIYLPLIVRTSSNGSAQLTWNWDVGEMVYLCEGTVIHHWDSPSHTTTVPEDNWPVLLTRDLGGGKWDTYRADTGGRGWVEKAQATSCEDGNGGGDGGDGEEPPPPPPPPPSVELEGFWNAGNGTIVVKARVTSEISIDSVELSTTIGTSDGSMHLKNGVYEGIIRNIPPGVKPTFTVKATNASGTTSVDQDGQVRVTYSESFGGCNDNGPPTCSVKDPVDTATGNSSDTFVDLVVPGRGDTDIVIGRSINSQSEYDGPFGRGTTFEYDMAMDVVDNIYISGMQVRYGDGHTVNFNDAGGGRYTSVTPNDADFVLKHGSDYVLYLSDMSKSYHFSSDGTLREIRNQNGAATTLTYSGDRLSSITNASGRTVTLTWSENHITEIRAPADKTLAYTYSGDTLVAFTDAKKNTTTYTYDASNRLTAIINPDGTHRMRQDFDERGRVTWQIVGTSDRVDFHYDDTTRITKVTDAHGHDTSYVYDANYFISSVINALGNANHAVHNNNGHLIQYTDRRGYTTNYGYDNRGNVTQRIDPVDTLSQAIYTQDVATWEYNDQNKPVRATDALGNVTTFEYDGNTNLIALHEQGNRTTKFTYNQWGQPLTMTDPNNNTTTYNYDSSGNLVAITDAAMQTTTVTYDELGRELSITDAQSNTIGFTYDKNDNITRITDPKGNSIDLSYDANNQLQQVVDRRNGITRYEYDPNQRVSAVIDAENYRIEYTYDFLGNLTAIKDRNGNITRHEYNSLSQLIQTTDAEERITRYEYDAEGNLITIIDSSGRRTRLSYDAMNRLKYVTNPQGERMEFCYNAEDQLVQFFNPRRALTRYEYDEVGNLIRMLDPLGEETLLSYDKANNLVAIRNANKHTRTFAYDQINRVIRERSPLGHETHIAYDSVGNVLTMTDPLGNQTHFAYDGNNNLIATTDALSATVEFGYDAEDNRTTITDGRGFTTQLTYDKRGLITRVTEPGGYQTLATYDGEGNLSTMTNASGHQTAYLYNKVNQPIKKIDPLGFATLYGYDETGRLTSVTDAENNTTSYHYDKVGRLTGVTDALTQTTRYAYDLAGNLTTITDTNGIATRFDYNYRDELVKETNPLSHTWEYGYDGAGNLTSRRDGNWQATRYVYDADDRLTEVRYPSPRGTSGETISFVYDAASNERAMTDWNGTTTHEYDALNRRVRSVNFDGTVLGYRYNASSNLSGLVYPNSQVVSYTLDARNLVSALRDPSGDTIAYAYDPAGALTTITRPNNTATTYSYDNANRLVGIAHNRGETTLSAFDYVLDKVGNRTQVTEQRTFAFSGFATPVTTRKHYRYDAIYRLTGVDITNVTGELASAPPSTATAFDRASLTSDHPFMTYSFDPAGNRMTQAGMPQDSDPTSELVPATPSAPIQNVYSYNHANQLVATDSTSTTTTLVYDDKGNRLSETNTLTTGETLLTTYTYDHDNRMVGVTKSISTTDGITTTMDGRYTYDRYGRRIRKEVKTAAATQVITTVYLGLDSIADYETVTIGDTAITTATHYYRANGSIAEIERLPNPATGFAGDRHWTHADGLGSILDLTDETGAITAQAYYDEYGQLLTAPMSLLRYSFTSQEYDPETGFYHFYARYYDPAHGVWLTQDPYRGELTNPTTLHRYGYVGGNPINNYDYRGYYTIQLGDTLSEIADKHGTNVQKIMELNPHIKDPNLIYALTELNLPNESHKSSTSSRQTCTSNPTPTPTPTPTLKVYTGKMIGTIDEKDQCVEGNDNIGSDGKIHHCVVFEVPRNGPDFLNTEEWFITGPDHPIWKIFPFLKSLPYYYNKPQIVIFKMNNDTELVGTFRWDDSNILLPRPEEFSLKPVPKPSPPQKK